MLSVNFKFKSNLNPGPVPMSENIMRPTKQKMLPRLFAALQMQPEPVEPAPQIKELIDARVTAPVPADNSPALPKGWPPMHAAIVAIANDWHLNKYYYELSENRWYLILRCKCENGVSTWTRMRVNSKTGAPESSSHQVTYDMWADRFASHPFDVCAYLNGTLPSTFDWFCNTFAAGRKPQDQKDLFAAYEERLRNTSSWQALCRIGLMRGGKH